MGQVVTQYLRASCDVSAIVLWGRSMGATASVLRAAADPTLAACVLDSPFSSFSLLAREIVKNVLKVHIPNCILSLLLQSIRLEIQSHANFDIEDLEPIRT